MMVGDFNVTLDPGLDNLNIRYLNARAKLKDLMDQHDYSDMFRALRDHERKRWGTQQKARLDICISSNSLLQYICDFEILPAFRSDHCPIKVVSDFDSFERRRGFWKHNNALLGDQILQAPYIKQLFPGGVSGGTYAISRTIKRCATESRTDN